MELLLDLKNYEKSDTMFKRTAARAIVKRGDLYLLIHSKYGDYKFPGGGVNKGETLEEAMIREVQEETGFQVLKETVCLYGKVLERRKGSPEDILEMESYYFFCGVDESLGERNLDEYEQEYDYRVIWLPLSEAIEKNRQMIHYDRCPWVSREMKVMETLNMEFSG
jgi:8-oxo-dGTP pyrophosphatase MutT (NUDIX family)